MTTTVLAASGVWKSYDGRSDVLRDVNLEAQAGEAVLIWGANGSGKTTLLSILGGLDIPTKGSVLLGGPEIARLKESALRSEEHPPEIQSPCNLLCRLF